MDFSIIIIVLLTLLGLQVFKVDGVYFSISNLELNLPTDPTKEASTDLVLANFRALPTRRIRKPHLRYSLVENDYKDFKISPITGDLFFGKGYFLGKGKESSRLTVKVSATDSSGGRNETSFAVNFSTQSTQSDLDCDMIVTDLCFWQSATYSILENREASLLGTLSSPYLVEMCHGFKINYTITGDESRVSVQPPAGPHKSWSLKARGHLERDVHKYVKSFPKDFGPAGEVIRVPVLCTILDPQGTGRNVTRELEVRVLDENDNLPHMQDEGDVQIVLQSNVVFKDQSVDLKHHGTLDQKLVLIDRDSKAVNGHRYEILNDTLDILKLNCTQFDENAQQESQTVTNCKFFFTKDMKLPATPYAVVLQINDTTLVGHGNQTVLRIPIRLHTPDSTDHPHALGLTVAPERQLKPLLLYPSRKVSVFRSAGPFARVTQPKENEARLHSFEILNDSSHNGAFNITDTEGILYIRNISLLRKSPANIRLTISWSNGSNFETDDITVNIIEEPSDTCSDKSTSFRDWAHCSEFQNPKDCDLACAIATGGSTAVRNRAIGGPRRCTWRGDRKPDHKQTTLYSTCTPDIETCPNGICDSHEQLYFKICPQDCTREVIFPTTLNPKTKQGITTASGVCTCDDFGKCTCHQQVKASKIGKKTTSTTTSTPNPTNTTLISGVCNCKDTVKCVCFEWAKERKKLDPSIALVNQTLMNDLRLIHGMCMCDDTRKCLCALKDGTNGKKTGKNLHVDDLLLISGGCYCNDLGRCWCNVNMEGDKSAVLLRSGEDVSTSPAPNLSRHTGPEMASCGKGCLLGILAGGLFLIGAIATAVACWRFDKVHKVRGKYTGDANDLSAPLSDYVDRGLGNENTITLNFDMTTSLNQHEEQKLTSDPKWEFPRSQLIIEQTLGEGEFGRVLRARARDIAGQSGYTIVAVKTLKDDAREAELADLLSEYELLKGVSHPNIIRLLGASTLPGGPVYLIIEFAQFGSLRSYLRRSRHLKSESRMPFSVSLEENSIPNYDEPRQCKVTPTDILSFAWQISNGMSYLSDVKLVHRDLAARNVLLTEEKVCKISDFGLTRDIYEDDAYFKRSKGRVPVKWMAPESLSDHVYTCKSDVWSFGILVWELVTLGATPYPGIQVQNLFHLLKSGYRMERPDNCSPALYRVMRSCWHLDAELRPSFHELTSRWEKMLGDQVEYLDLTPNAIHNRSYFCTLDDNEEDENENNENTNNEENLEDNLADGKDCPKCGDSDKLLEEPKPSNVFATLQLSPIAQGYETPVKNGRQERARTPTNDEPQYYTNMDAAKK